MLLFGVISTLLGLLIVWQYSLLLGMAFLAPGLFLILKGYATEAPREHRDYQAEAPTYNIRSSPKR